MPQEVQDVEHYLSVGSPMVFHSNPGHQNAPRYLTALRGWRKPNYLLVDRPKIGGRFALIHEDQTCVVRFISGGAACAFDSAVIDWDSRQQNPFCRITWPKGVTVVGFRKTERVPVHIPCVCEWGHEKQEGAIKDISVSGCCVRIATAPPPKSEIMLSFRLPNGSSIDRVRCTVQSVRQIKQFYNVGCATIPDQVAIENEIAFFIMSGFNRKGSETCNNPRILIVSDNQDLTLPFKNLLEFLGFEPVFACTTVDGMCRLRMAEPKAICLDQAQHDLPGIEVARMLRVTPGFAHMPIFLLNVEDEFIQKDAESIAITGCFNSKMSVPQVVQTMTGHLKQLQEAE